MALRETCTDYQSLVWSIVKAKLYTQSMVNGQWSKRGIKQSLKYIHVRTHNVYIG